MSIVALGAIAMACLFSMASCSRQEEASTSPVLARVGDRVITVDDFDREVERLQGKGQPLPEKETLLQDMIAREAAISRAIQEKLDQDPEIKRMMENLLIGQLRDRELEAKLREAAVGDEELRAAYDSQIERYTSPEKVRLAILKVNTSPGMSEARRAEARSRIAEARQRIQDNPAPGGRGASANGFGKLAVEYSEDQASRYRGGDIGWLDAGSYAYHWPRPVLEAGYSSKEGEISEIIETENALYLAVVTDHRERSVTPFDKVAESLRQKALATKRSRLKEEFQEETSRLAVTEIDTQVLASINLPADRAQVADSSNSEPPALPGAN